MEGESHYLKVKIHRKQNVNITKTGVILVKNINNRIVQSYSLPSMRKVEIPGRS